MKRVRRIQLKKEELLPGLVITILATHLLLRWSGYGNRWISFALTLASIAAIAILLQQYQTMRSLKQEKERYYLALQGSGDGVWDWHLDQNTLYLSPAWKALLGYSETDIPFLNRFASKESRFLSPVTSSLTTDAGGAEISPRFAPLHTWFDWVVPEDLPSLQAALTAHLEGVTPRFEHQYRMKHRDGSYRWMLSRGVAVRDQAGRVYRLVGSQMDTTERTEAEEQLRRNAFYDGLTGLPNRALFLERLQDAIALNQKYPNIAFAVLWLDFDHFKLLNNSLGSSIGDRLLVAAAQRLKAFLPAEDVIARNSGDEFIILLNHIRDATDATRMADRLQQLLTLPFNLDEHEIFTTVSIGIALSSFLYDQPEHLLRDADTAMHRAKALGRARYQVFDVAMHTHLRARLQLENDLRRAIAASQSLEGDRQELLLYYQPIVHLATGQVSGFEALVRWHHAEQGMISPGRFIPMAEETRLIIPLGWWVLREACRQMHQWQQQFASATTLTINVNLSSKQFSMSGLAEHIRQVLQETGLNPSALKLELTESTVMDNASSVVAVLQHLRAIGIQIAIDDFGTGYSSLSYLPRFPINTLKIDRSFVQKMSINPDSMEIVRTILSLAHNLNIDVTAEGVEIAEQARQLIEMKCEYGQGYFFARPMSATAATDFLHQRGIRAEGWRELRAEG